MLEANNLPNGIVVDPFPNLIWKYHYDFNIDELRPKILNAIEQYGGLSALETGASQSTIAGPYEERPHRWPELQPFIHWLEHALEFQWTHHNYVYVEKRIGESWFNIHKKTGETLEHHHNGIGLVVTCYISLPENGGFIEFRDPLEYHKAHTPIIPEQELWKQIECKSGDILIFPGWLKHRTQPNMSDEDRIVLTLNIR